MVTSKYVSDQLHLITRDSRHLEDDECGWARNPGR